MCEAREKEQKKQARRDRRHQEQLLGAESVASDGETFAGRYTVTLRGCDTPRLAYGVRGGLIAVVAAPLNHHASAAGIMAGDEVVAVDSVPIGSSKVVTACVSTLEAAVIQRMQGLRGRRAVRWVLRRPRRALAAQQSSDIPASPVSSSSSSSSSLDLDVNMLEMSDQERRLMGALSNTAAG